MKKILIILIFTFFSFQATSQIAINNYKYCNSHKFTFLLLKVYDVYLCADKKEYFSAEKIFKTNFSVIINYDMNFDKEELSISSIEEISRYYQKDEKTLKNYYNQLMQIFPNVKKTDWIEAKFNKQGSVNFYHNNRFSGKIKDPEFSEIFLNIWLHKNNKYQKMIKDLYEQNF